MSIEANLAAVRQRIETAARRAGRDPAGVTLVAVTKGVPAERVVEAYRLGVRHFGENRVEEAIDKIPSVRALPAETRLPREHGPVPEHPTWHMIGHLQRRKVRDAVSLFEMIHSVDSVRLAEEIHKRASAAGKVMPVLLEVNVSADPAKYGFEPESAADAVAEILRLPHLQIRGLMTMAPIVSDPEEARPVFRRLRELSETLQRRFPLPACHDLSMGMTDDFEPAVEEGATLVRIGRAIFGERLVCD